MALIYFRVHTADKAYLTQLPRGLFTAIGKLVDGNIMSPLEVEEYWKQRKWFEASLPVPPFYEDGNRVKAITWYKNSPQGLDMYDRMNFYFAMAGKYEIPLFRTETDKLPGKLIYEDEFQVGVTGSNHEGPRFRTAKLL